jgi:hypothetical protein
MTIAFYLLSLFKQLFKVDLYFAGYCWLVSQI